MYIEKENVIPQNKYVYIDKCSSIIMQKMHTHTHTQTHKHTQTHTHTHLHTHTNHTKTTTTGVSSADP